MYSEGKFCHLYCSRNNNNNYFYDKNSRIKCGCADAANYKLEEIIKPDRLKYEFRKKVELVSMEFLYRGLDFTLRTFIGLSLILLKCRNHYGNAKKF
jgi:hypothetical protein